MVATFDRATLGAEPAMLQIGVLERNRSVLQRAARVMRAAANLDWVAAEEDPLALRAQLDPSTRLLACEASDAELVLGWIGDSFPSARLAVWSHETAPLIELAERDDRVVSLIGWPRFQSMPRSWEIALATRMLLAAFPEPTSIADVFAGVPMVAEFRPAAPAERDEVVLEISRLVERTGGADRLTARIGEVAHELIMNATYDAPVDASGEPRYAKDRRAGVVLERDEVPLVQFATDGLLIALRVSDPFGRLSRDHVVSSIRRGSRAASAVASEVVDRSYGGAGLGIWRVYSSAAVTIVDVIPGHSTTVTVVFDVDLGPREARTLPPSLHLFDRGRFG